VAVPSGDLTAGFHSMEGQVLALQDEKAQIFEALRSMQEQQQQMQLQQQQQEKELSTLLARRQSDEQQASVVGELRAEVAVIASAVNTLCGRVEQLSTNDSKGALQTEIGAIASIVNKLSERVDRIDPREQRRPQSPLKLSTADRLQLTPEHLSPQLHWPGSDAGGESLDNSTTLRHQLAALVGDVRKLSVGSGIGLPVGMAKAAQPPSSAFRAPSPKRWLDEPLSVSVARSSDEQMVPSPTAERILHRAAATAVTR